jgi:hypothetical protein
MKYALLIYGDESGEAPAEDQVMSEYFAFTESVQKSGHMQAGEALEPVATAKTVRVRGGQTEATDGPFAETKEQLGGFYIVDCADLDEAIGIAARIPGAKWGAIEVRPIVVFEMP